MIHITEIATAFLVLSGLIGTALLVFAVNAYRNSRNPALAFVAGAFTLFALKSFLVGYSVKTKMIEHELLELITAIADLGILLLFLVPILWPPREP